MGEHGSLGRWAGRSSRAGARVAGLALLAAAVVGLGAGAAQARWTTLETAHGELAKPAGKVSAAGGGVSAKLVVSPNWSGYVARAPVKPTYADPYFTRVTGTWTVPKATCGKPKAIASSTVWVGIGGYASRDQEEVGTDSNCSAKGKPIYYAWFELVPYLSYRAFPSIKSKVDPGDTMTGLVQILSPTLVKLQLHNRTKGWTFSRKITFSSQDTSTADWVVEAPANCIKYSCYQASLANFGQVTMRKISAVGRGTTGTLRDPRWKVIPVKLVPSKLIVPTISDSATAAGPGGKRGQAKSPAGSTPGPVSPDGTSFKLRWVKVATKGL
jgi:Peptidase A4 family